MAKISKTKIDEVIKAYPVVPVYVKATEDINIEVYPVISFVDFGKAVREAATLSFAVDPVSGEEIYAPYLSEFAYNYAILKYFTNVNVDIKTGDGYADEKASERLWKLMWSPVMTNIINAIDTKFLIMFESAWSDALEEKKLSIRPGAAKLWRDLDELISGIKEQFDGVDANQTAELIEKLNGLGDKEIVKAMI